LNLLVTDKPVFRRAIASLVFLFAASSAAAQILGTSARQQPVGSLKFLAYYQGVSEQTVNFSVSGARDCATTNGVSFACGQGGDVEGSGKGGAGMVKLAWQAAERFAPYALFGVGDYTLSVPSTTVGNTLYGDSLGLLYGAGLRASVVPDTQFGPGIALDVSVTRAQYKLDRIEPGGTPGRSNDIDSRLTLMTYQVAVEASHLFAIDEHWKLEPYGGVKWMRVDASLKDRVNNSRAGGKNDVASPFLGLRVPAEDRIAFFAESSFVDGYQYGAGLELRFN